MTCSECRKVYHLGQSCSGIADSTFTTMGPVKRDKWRCRSCRSQEPRRVPSGVSQDDPQGVLTQLSLLHEKIDSLMTVKKSVDSLCNLPAKVDELMALKPAFDFLQSTVGEVQKSIEFLSNQYDSVLSRVAASELALRETQAETASLRATVSEQSLTINQLRDEVNEAEQYSRLSNLEISGLPVLPGENLAVRVCDLADRIGLSGFQAIDIQAVHRLPSRKDKTPVVLIRFRSVSIKDRWMSARSNVRSLAEAESGSRIYFNENLTRANRELFWLARNQGKEKKYKFVWVKNGKIFARKLENAPLVRINHANDLEKLV